MYMVRLFMKIQPVDKNSPYYIPGLMNKAGDFFINIV